MSTAESPLGAAVALLVSGLTRADAPCVEGCLATLATLAQNGESCITPNGDVAAKPQVVAAPGMWPGVPGAAWSVLPIQAAVGSALREDLAARAVEALIGAGASVNDSWDDSAGQHTPLSLALERGRYALARLLLRKGADPTAALLNTNLMVASCFDPEAVRILLHSGARVGTPSACWQVLARLGAELEAVRGKTGDRARPVRDSRALAAGLSADDLLTRASKVLQLLSAAGAEPVALMLELKFSLHSAISEADWERLEPWAARPLQWTPERHALFPPAFRAEACQVLLLGTRPLMVGASDSNGQELQLRLDVAATLCIIEQLAAARFGR